MAPLGEGWRVGHFVGFGGSGDGSVEEVML